jgi:K+-transporting ATPase KdpF subunit
LPRASGSDRSGPMLYVTAVTTVLALLYLVYAMIRPERF